MRASFSGLEAGSAAERDDPDAADGRLFAGLPQDTYVYFVHSYYLKAEDENIVTAATEYGTLIHASVEKGNVFACQFHPEKSSEAGRQMLKNFIAVTHEEKQKENA